ncbi:hypothetical protein DAPPUDRAFT_320669 [Daphnia pulex]|uniref:Uncharacterized protein n=1 Tax=Daphnia pulex TaxID=6669 RepID=E9GQU5_DAPPU|nr:hypothetical protein DAPPUDRAFT_320669 [Daphnia pulex]|eukprot:EFX78269.1 hypothetical protein DAPPUDRAFT_320669 [Daphnia pulex]
MKRTLITFSLTLATVFAYYSTPDAEEEDDNTGNSVAGYYDIESGTLNNPALVHIGTPDEHNSGNDNNNNNYDVPINIYYHYQHQDSQLADDRSPGVPASAHEINPTHINFLIRFFRSFAALPAIFRHRFLCNFSPSVSLDNLNCFTSLE